MQTDPAPPSPPDAAAPAGPPDAAAPAGPRGVDNWLLYVLPMIGYVLLGSLDPPAPEPGDAPERGWLGFTHDHYPALYAAKLVATVGLLAWAAPAWRQWPVRITPWGIAVGVLGAPLWIALCGLGIEDRFVELIGKGSGIPQLLGLGERPSYNPWDHFGDRPGLLWSFLAVRFAGLALVVPLLEELMLRGWLVRSIVSPDFWRVEFGRLTVAAAVVGTAFPMLYHPEKIASLGWFTLVTALMARTRSFWDCVVAHALTNLLLGLWVVNTGAWRLW